MKLKQIKEKFTEITELKAIAANGRKYLKVKKDFRRKDTWQFVLNIVEQLKLTPILLSELSEFYEAMDEILPDGLADDFVITIGNLIELNKLEDAVNYDWYVTSGAVEKLERLKREKTEKWGGYYNLLKEYCHQYIKEPVVDNWCSKWEKYCMFMQYSGLYINDLDITPATGKEVYLSSVDEWNFLLPMNLSLFISIHPPSHSIEEAMDTAWDFYLSNKGYAKRSLLASFISKKEGKGWKYIDHRYFDYGKPEESTFKHYGINGDKEHPWNTNVAEWLMKAEAETKLELDNIAEVLIYCFEYNELAVNSAIERYRTEGAKLRVESSVEKAFKECTTLSELKKERNKLAAIYHPDKGGSTELMQIVNNLFEKYKPTVSSSTNYSSSSFEELLEKLKRQAAAGGGFSW